MERYIPLNRARLGLLQTRRAEFAHLTTKAAALRIALALFAISWPLEAAPLQATQYIKGIVTDQSGAPVVGASVYLTRCEQSPSPSITDEIICGVVADVEGAFRLQVPDTIPAADLCAHFDALGFASSVLSIGAIPSPDNFRVTLTIAQVTVEKIEVTASRSLSDAQAINSQDMAIAAERTLAPSNALAVVRGPEVVRSGPGLGSLIRFHGESPQYNVGGVNIGVDQSHYGMFSLLPASVLGQVEFSDHSISARNASPGVVALSPRRNFGSGTSQEITLSTLEANASFTLSSQRATATGALRKSTLDKIVNNISAKSERVTIPPTNFEDIVVWSALRLSPSLMVSLDQYHAQDFLAFNTAATSLNTAGVATFQHTRRRFVTAGIDYVSPRTLLKFRANSQFSKALYSAEPLNAPLATDLSLRLAENEERHQISLDALRPLGASQVTVGALYDLRVTPSLTLSQRNWNFLPPFATSDAPTVYQQELNSHYGTLDMQARDASGALYGEWSARVGAWEGTFGTRLQLYDHLAVKNSVLYRGAIQRPLSKRVLLGLSAGTYAAAPYGAIIDPYQTLIRSAMGKLKPQKTTQMRMSVDARLGATSDVAIYSFVHTVSDAPRLLALDSSQPLGAIATQNVVVRSCGRETEKGVGVSYRGASPLPRLGPQAGAINVSYSYTHLRSRVALMRTFSSADAPHRFECDYQVPLSRGWELGALFTARSGFRYTPHALWSSLAGGAEKSSAEALQNENSARFPTHTTLNLSASYRFSSGRAFFSVGNALNRANPIIRASDGFVYDNGILPSVGVTLAL